MLLNIHPNDPQDRKIQQVVKTLESGGVIIYPTDTVYALGCDIMEKKAIERICRIRQLDPAKVNLTIVCSNISQVAEYAHQIDNQVFKVLKRNLPGPFTFILKSSQSLPKLLKNKRKTIGVRIPNNAIVAALIESLGRPMLSISLKSDDEIIEYFTNPSEIYDDFAKLVDIVVDGGVGGNTPSSIVDCSKDEIDILREGEMDLIY